MAYYLRDHGLPFKKIMHGKKWVGRVCRHGDGGYLGIIGKESVRAATEREAFEEIAARAMGYHSAAALHASNRRGRQAKRVYDRAADAVGREFFSSGPERQVEIIDRLANTPQGASLLLRGVTRNLRK